MAAVVQGAGDSSRVMCPSPGFGSFAYNGLPVGLTAFTVMSTCGDNSLAAGNSHRRAGKDHGC